MAVEPVGSENIIQEFEKHQSMAEMKMSSDTRSSDRASDTNRRAGKIIETFLGNLHDWQENRELLEGINGHKRFLIHQVSFRTWCHLRISHK